MLLTGTVSPSLALIAVSTPDAGDGISASTLSVEISNSGSSRSTASPTFLIHRTIVPSAIDSPICGISTGVDMRNPCWLPAAGYRSGSGRAPARRSHVAGGDNPGRLEPGAEHIQPRPATSIPPIAWQLPPHGRHSAGTPLRVEDCTAPSCRATPGES